MTSLEHEEFKGTDRFTVQRRLGSGSFGVVYQVYDCERKNVVALKTLRKSLYSENADALYRFKQEFRALTDVIHPNLVALYELIYDCDLWFFTMELVNGINFLDYLRGGGDPEVASVDTVVTNVPSVEIDASDTVITEVATVRTDETELAKLNIVVPAKLPVMSCDIDRLREAFRQLSEGVCALHEAGKLHRDLKPSNVLVTQDGRVVMLDFGLVTELAAASQEENILVGTPTHMAPEQAAGANVDEASDWYSVGVMLYESLTGRLPFTGSLFEILNNKQKMDAPEPRTLVDNVPEDLNQLCMELLNRDPRHRPRGQEVLDCLKGYASMRSAPRLKRTRQSTDLSLVGREHHLDRLQEAFERSRTGRSMLVYLHGASGMGKSVLARHFLDKLAQNANSTVVLTGRCFEQESVPYKAWDSLIDELARYLKTLPQTEIEKLVPRDANALARLFPVMGQIELIKAMDNLDLPDSRELRRRAFAALRELCANIARTRSLVLFIDDLQWGDADSAALLAELLRPPEPPPLLLIASYRSEDAEANPLLQALLALPQGILSEVSTIDIEVGELSLEESQELALYLMGSRPYQEQAQNIAQESGGNPFFIDELVRNTLKSRPAKTGLLRPLDSSGQHRLNLTTLDNLVQTRVDELPNSARRSLEVVSVAGQPIELPALRLAANLNGEEQSSLVLLRARHLIRVITAGGEEKVETYHNRIRESVIAHLDNKVRTELHRNLALALEETGRIDAERLAVHYEKAGEREKAVNYAIQAADQAARALAFDRAARLYRRAIELGTGLDASSMSREQVHTLFVKLADALANAGRSSEAGDEYLGAALSATGDEKLELKRRAAEQFLICGRIDEGLDTLNEVLQSVGLRLAPTPKRALLSLIVNRLRLKLRGTNFIESDRAGREELMRIDTCWSVIIGLTFVDTIRAADFQARHLLFALKAGEPYRVARALAMETGHSAVAGGRSRAHADIVSQKAKALAEKIGNKHAIGLAMLTAGALDYFNGEWKRALELTEHAEEIFREHCTGIAWELDAVLVYSLRSLSFMGELNVLLARLPRLYKEAESRGDLWAKTLLRSRFYVAYLAADDVEGAIHELDVAITQWSRQGYHMQHYWDMFGNIECELYRGRALRAWQLVEERWPLLTGSLLLRVQVFYIESLHLRARAALALALQSDRSSIKEAERCAKKIERERMDWGLAFARLIRAGIATARGRKPEAIALTAQAEQGFKAAHMKLYEMASRRVRGQMLGGSEGQELIASADAWMTTNHIRVPEKITAMLAPGKWV